MYWKYIFVRKHYANLSEIDKRANMGGYIGREMRGRRLKHQVGGLRDAAEFIGRKFDSPAI